MPRSDVAFSLTSVSEKNRVDMAAGSLYCGEEGGLVDEADSWCRI